MLLTPRGLGGYSWSFSSTGSTRITGAWGTSVTPGNNTYGSYAQVCSSANVARDVFGILINFNSNNVATAARDTICTIGVDPAGGTSYVDTIPHLLASSASAAINVVGGGGLNYFFPLYIKSGSTIACKASVNNATVGTLRCRVRLFGAPRDRRSIRVGTRVEAVGINTGTSSGTSVTPGTTSEGSWTSLGSIAADDYPWWWQYGVGVNQGTITATSYSGDLSVGDASQKLIVGEDRYWMGTTNETWADNGVGLEAIFQAAGGQSVFGRLQCSGTAITGLSMAAYYLL